MENKLVIQYTLSKIFNGNMFAVAGVMANIQCESNYISNNLQNSYNKSFGLTDEEYTYQVDTGKIDMTTFAHDHAGYGLCQWTHWSRKQTMYDYIKTKKGLSIGSLDGQVDYLEWDLKSNYTKLYNKLCESKTADEACRYFMLEYEKPANQSDANIARRCQIAIDIYNEITSMTTKRSNILSALSIIKMQMDIIEENLK